MHCTYKHDNHYPICSKLHYGCLLVLYGPSMHVVRMRKCMASLHKNYSGENSKCHYFNSKALIKNLFLFAFHSTCPYKKYGFFSSSKLPCQLHYVDFSGQFFSCLVHVNGCLLASCVHVVTPCPVFWTFLLRMHGSLKKNRQLMKHSDRLLLSTRCLAHDVNQYI